MERSSSASELSIRNLNGRVPLVSPLKKSRSTVLLPALNVSSPGLPSITLQNRTQPFSTKVWSPGKSCGHRRIDSGIEAWPGEKASMVTAAKEAAQAKQKVPVETEEEAVAKKLVDLDMPHLDGITTMYIGHSFADMDGDGEKSLDDVAATQALSNLLKQNNGGIEVNEDEAENQELQQIITGEDAIAYFAKSGSVSKTKLLYANRVESEHFAPYELVVVPQNNVNPEYFTISATGIVHVAPGQLSECILLTEWVHQSLMFRVLRSMNFFKHYIHKKMMAQWRAKARYEVYCHRRQRLTRCCFFAKPMFVDFIVQVNSLVHEVEEVKIMHVDQNCVYSIQEFMDKQQQILASPVNSAQKDFEQKHEAAIGIIDRLIATVQSAFHIEPTVDQLASSKSKSMVQEKEEAREKARLLRIAKRDEEMIGDCIRMIDFMFQAALVQTVYDAVKQFWARLDQKTKLFVISVDMTDSAITLDPGIYDFMDMHRAISEGWFQTLSKLQSMTCVRQYDQFCRGQDHQSVKDIMLKDRIYLAYQANIQDFITGAIEDAQANSNTNFERFRKIFEFGKTWDSAGFNETEHNYDELSVHMNKMRWFQEELASFKVPQVASLPTLGPSLQSSGAASWPSGKRKQIAWVWCAIPAGRQQTCSWTQLKFACGTFKRCLRMICRWKMASW